MKFGWTFLVALVLAMAPMLSAAERLATLDLGDGYAFELLSAGDTPARVGNPKSIFVQVALTEANLQGDKAKVLEAADRLFESVLLEAAEKGYYKRASVRMRNATGSFDEFAYVRGENDVWLRQAGAQPWITAQDPNAWTPPPVQDVAVQGFGTFRVEAALEIAAPEGFRRAAEVDFVTTTPMIDIQRKYQEIKALWSRIDREQMRKDGFDLVMIGNFSVSLRGRFHARKGFFVRLPREADGPWPELPASAPDNRDLLISRNEVQIDELASLIRNSFAIGLGQPPAALEAVTATVAAPPPAVATDVGFSRVVPSMRIKGRGAVKIQ